MHPVLNIMVYPKHRWYEQIMIPEFSGMKFFEPEIFSKKFQFKFLITEKIQVPRLKTSRKVTSKFWNWSLIVVHALPSVRLLGWHSLRLAEDSQRSPRLKYQKSLLKN